LKNPGQNENKSTDYLKIALLGGLEVITKRTTDFAENHPVNDLFNSFFLELWC
jgi:hypothetical protein